MDFRMTISYISQKIGHFSGFAIFAVLLISQNKRMGKSIILAVVYAILTEFLQLYFGRHGRLYDIAIDTAGIICGVIILRMAKMLRY
ncbi:MAG: VanZ family protein [Bacillota bacterium]